jgi:uncharacterized membrane protein
MSIRHNFVIRLIRGRPRLFSCIVAGVLVVLLLPRSVAASPITRLVIGWNATTCLYLIFAGITMMRATHEQIRDRARVQDEGRWLILFLVNFAAVASLAAIIAELSIAKGLVGTGKYEHIGLAALTIFSSWAFTHMMFALHYAHDYYAACTHDRAPGLEFPGGEMPDYSDFLYFSCIIGTSAQTADVNITTRAMRRISLLHCLLAFLFNTTVLALTINIAASLI